jgi:hypothetical protein
VGPEQRQRLRCAHLQIDAEAAHRLPDRRATPGYRAVQPLGALALRPGRPHGRIAEGGGHQLAHGQGLEHVELGNVAGAPEVEVDGGRAGEGRLQRQRDDGPERRGPDQQFGEHRPPPTQVRLDGEDRLPGVLGRHARPGAHRELQPLGDLGVTGAGAERDPLLGGVHDAQPRAVDRQHARAGTGQPDGEQLGADEVGLGRPVERRLEPLGDGHS